MVQYLVVFGIIIIADIVSFFEFCFVVKIHFSRHFLHNLSSIDILPEINNNIPFFFS